MDFGDPYCTSQEVVTECSILSNSVASFQALPYERKIRLAISHHLNKPLNLTLHHGLCNISCEGGLLNSCNTTTQDYYWQNMSTPFYFENCNPLYHYCLTATIEDCCPICTETIFMKDYHPGAFSANSYSLSTIIFAVAILTIFVGVVVFVIKHYIVDYNIADNWRFKEAVHLPLNEKKLDLENRTREITVVCLYIKEENQSFINGINFLQSFLRSRGFNVIDIYNEEENINRSVHHWVQTIMKRDNTKIVLLETDLFRLLWNYDLMIKRIVRPVEEAILYVRSSITLSNLHNKLFVVRFQTNQISTEGFIDLGNGRCYMYPINRERLAEHLMNIQISSDNLIPEE